MIEQPEALRLADWLETFNYPKMEDSAAELRRLEGEIERKSDAIQRLWKERDDLRVVNAQLLEALGFIANRQNLMFAECSDAEEIIEVARAAIKAAKGEV
jgi:regulator of sirC expression with transglutaminase-like and TPR domain